MTSARPVTVNTGRAADLAFLRRCLQRGEHASIVGVNNMGKTAVLRSVSEMKPDALTVYIDCNRVLEWTEVGFYEIVVRAILDALPLDDPCRAETQNYHTILVAPTTLLEDAYAFVAALRAVIGSVGRLVLLLDEFDNLLRRLDARVFLNLRGLADQYGSSLVYITATTHRLSLLRADVEPFYELFNYRTRYLSTLKSDEVRQHVLEYAEQLGVMFEDAEIQFIDAQSGGHPGLVRAIAHFLSDLRSLRPNLDNQALLLQAGGLLSRDANVEAECAGIWNELLDIERDALAAVAIAEEPAEPAATYVRAKYLVHSAEDGEHLFCSAFTDFVIRTRRIQVKGQASLRVDTERGDVYINGRVIPPLTDLEYKLLALLNQRQGQIVDKYQIVENVWGEAYLDQVDDDRIERLIARVREKIEPDPRQPRFLTTVRGRGYRLRTE